MVRAVKSVLKGAYLPVFFPFLGILSLTSLGLVFFRDTASGKSIGPDRG